MIVIVDIDTLKEEEIEVLSKYRNIFKSDNPTEIPDNLLPNGQPYNILYITRGNNSFKLDLRGFNDYATVIKITDNIIWDESEYMIDAKVKSVDDFINKNIFTLLGEKLIYNNNLKFDNNNASLIHEIRTENIGDDLTDVDFKNIDYFSIGRYFPTKKGNNNLHIYSSRIIKSKYDEKSKDIYRDLFDAFLKFSNLKYDYIFYVPCKSTKIDRFENINATKGICLVRDYGDIKELSYDEKLVILKDKFAIKAGIDLIGKKILLVDDVLTSGATLKTITILLYNNNALKVDWFTFGRNYHSNFSMMKWICAKCETKLAIRFRNKDGQWFLACPNYDKCQFNYNDSFHSLDIIYSNK